MSEAIFFDIQRGLPRQGPGDDAATLRALALCGDLPARAAILDVGCGPGMQTVVLAKATAGTIVAADTSDEYLGELQARAAREGVADRITAINADMSALPFPAESFDLVWSEGAAYIMGFDNALAAWRRLLKPGGVLGVSELVWLTAEPPNEVAAFFAEGYPAMRDVAAVAASIRANGYDLLGDFVLPDTAWWTHYYAPLAAKLPALRTTYAGDKDALAIVEMTAREIEMRQRFPDAYGYAFYVARRSA